MDFANSRWRTSRREIPRLNAIVVACLLLLFTATTIADTVYQAPERFIAQAFESEKPQIQTLWLDQQLRGEAQRILHHPFQSLRVRYWQHGSRTAWILDEIGKERPITLGVVVENDRIARVKVLTYRESRGGEVRQPFFTDQFIGASLGRKQRLDRGIDGVTGATLSVRAVTRVAQVALLFHQHVQTAATTLAQQ